MNPCFAFLDADGCPYQLGAEATMPEGAVPLPEGMTPEIAAAMYVRDGGWLLRPVIAPPVLRDGPAYSAVWSDVPDGAVARLMDCATGSRLGPFEASGGVIEITELPPGEYELDMTAPKPWLGFTVRVFSRTS